MMILLGLLLTTLFGLLFLRLIKFNGCWYEYLSAGFLISSGLQTFIFFLIIQTTDMVLPEIYWMMLLVMILLLLSLVFLISPPHPNWSSVNRLKRATFNFLPFISWSLILTLFAITLAYTFYTPVYTTDSLHLYDFRAKVMFHTQSLSAITTTVPSWNTYPMFTSLINLFMRFWGTDYPGFYYPLMYLSFAGIFYAFLRRQTTAIVSSLGTLAMYSTPLILWQSRQDGLTNLPYTIFFCSGVFYLLLATDESRLRLPHLTVAVLMLAFSNWTRINEPFWVIPLLILMIYLVKKPRWWFSLLLSYWLIRWPNHSWVNFVRSSSYVNLTKGVSVLISAITKPNPVMLPATPPPLPDPSLLNRVTEIFHFLWPILLSSLNPVIYIFPIFVISGLFVNHRRKNFGLLLVIFLCLLVLFAGTIYASIQFDYWRGQDNAVGRIIGLFIPLMWAYVFLSPIWQKLAP